MSKALSPILQRLILDPLFASAVLNWHILQMMSKGLLKIYQGLILDPSFSSVVLN